MRTLVDVPAKYIDGLAAICAARKLSRAEVVRQAIAAYIASQRPQANDQAFGLWKNFKQDGVAYQRKVRAEWR